MADLCTDNRFDLINKYRDKLVLSTNISSSPEEMQVLDNILFRFWQMGWLDILEEMEREFKTKCCKNCLNFSWPDFYGKTDCNVKNKHVFFDDGTNCEDFKMRDYWLPGDKYFDDLEMLQ